MSFHNISLPENIAVQSSMGPGFHSFLKRLDSGQERRASRWEAPRRVYRIVSPLRDMDTLYDLYEFIIGRMGSAYSFRLKDPSDYSTGSGGTGTPDFDDVTLGLGAATYKYCFQLFKEYTDNGTTYTRNITKPIADTVRVGVSGLEQTSGWSVNETNGVITFSSGIGTGETVTAGCEFEVPVRFSDEADKDFPLSFDYYDSGYAQNLSMIEVLDEGSIGEAFEYGGGVEQGTLSGNLTLYWGSGRVQAMNTGGITTRYVDLPTPTGSEAEGLYYYIMNNDGGAYIDQISVRDHNSVTIAQLDSDEMAICFLLYDGGWEWVATEAFL